jgi:hypothetical protein
MATYRLRVWVGPVSVVEMGRKLRRAGLRVPSTGTEHLTIDVKATDCTDATIKMRDALHRKYKKDFGLRPASCSRRPRSR